MSDTAKRGLIIGGGVLLLGVVAFFLLGNRDGSPLERVQNLVDPDPLTCPLTGIEPRKEALADRPAVAVKISNIPAAYPLSGLEDAEIVYEELVEGGLTRFMALYHCTDTGKVGPVRSSREVDAAIMTPITRILGAAGGNDQVRETLRDAEIVLIDENTPGGAMERIPRDGVSSEHTLYLDTATLRKVGRKEFDDLPPEDLRKFGDLETKGKRAQSISIEFGASSVSWSWDGAKWLRSDEGAASMSEAGEQLSAANVLIEEHTINYSGITDNQGAQSTVIEDVTGSGRAILFRDGRAIRGTWERDSVEGHVRFLTRDGEEMVFAQGATWIELVPSDKGEAKGSFEYGRN